MKDFPQAEDNSARTGQLLQLSLFIMLLAFFIVLNATSQYEKSRMENVLRTLDATFSEGGRTEWILPSTVYSEEESFKEGHVMDQLDALFESEIPVFTSKRQEGEGVMFVRVRTKYLDRVFAVSEGQKRSSFLLRLNRILQTGDPNRRPYEMELLIGLGGNPAKIATDNPQIFRAAIDKAGAYAEQATRNGLPAKYMSIGLHRGVEGFVDLRFRPYGVRQDIPDNRGEYIPQGGEP